MYVSIPQRPKTTPRINVRIALIQSHLLRFSFAISDGYPNDTNDSMTTITQALNLLDRMSKELLSNELTNNNNNNNNNDDLLTECSSSTVPLSRSSSTISSTTTTSIIPFGPQQAHPSERNWKPIQKDLLHIMGHDNVDSIIPLFRSLYDQAGVPRHVLQSIALLSTLHILPEQVSESCLDRLAVYLASPVITHHSKLACIRTLIVLTCPIEAPWQLEEGCLKETLEFLLDRTQDWTFPEHSEALLLWELRAKTIRYTELSEQDYRFEVEDVIKGSEVAADYIAGAAKWVERGLKWSVPVIHIGLETAGDSLKGMLTPINGPVNAQAVANCTNVAKICTNGVRQKAKQAANGVRDASSRGILIAAKRFEEEQLGLKLVPDQDHRNVLVAAGKVGIATLGGAYIVSDAVFETTKAVAQKTASVTADVVRYKYGDTAGQIIQDGCDTTGNILKTITHVAMLEGRILNKVVKNAGTIQFRSQYDEDSKEEFPDDPRLFLDSTTKTDAMAVLKRLQRTTKLLDKDVASTTRV